MPVPSPLAAAEQIAGAVKELIAFLRERAAGAPIRRMGAAIEDAEKYILTNEDTQLSEDAKKKLLVHYRKRFFATNN